VPACVVIAEKGETKEIEYPLMGQTLSGKLERKNASLTEAEKRLAVEDVEFSLHMRGKRSFWTTEKDMGAKGASFYKKHFAQGATIVPRSFWFVRVKPSPLGFNPHLPPLETDPRAIEEAKAAYQDVKLEGNVESQFLYATLLSTDLLPFGHLDYRLVVLPIELQGDHYKLIDANEARKSGFLHLARWLEKVGEEWVKRRGEKVTQMTIYERLTRVHGLTRQNPHMKYKVVYNKSGTFLTSAVIETEPMEFSISEQHLSVHGFIADHNSYYYEVINNLEASYLAAVLNAPIIDKLIKPMQSRGLWGPRDIHKKVLELPIPQFDTTALTHQTLAELGEVCSAKVEHWLASGSAGNIKSIGRLRGMVREMLKDELKEIDVLVKEILG
ncbi:MAG: hypothetical protein HY731_12125, partial [Candidatus Tectomicrobia bacterium]|nr:hypothetical protein [Candidatus Tectomicrobia bacterium]